MEQDRAQTVLLYHKELIGKPLVDIKKVMNEFSSTITFKGLKVKCVVDTYKYELKQQVTDERAESINLEDVISLVSGTISSGLQIGLSGVLNS